MYAVDFLIERLEEQIALAPKLEENQAPGGRSLENPSGVDYGTLAYRLKEGMGAAGDIKALEAIEGGKRRYVKHLGAALEHVEKLVPIFQSLGSARGASYADGAQREKAMGRFKDVPGQITAACKAAIAELEKAGKLLQEGEANKEARQAVAAK